MSRARILIVDDEVNQVRALAIGLRLEGFDVLTACDAAEARAVLETDRADAAIVDLMMPGTSGIVLARELHALYPEMRLLLTSAYHLSERQLVRADCGVVGFIPKPFRLNELAEFLWSKLPRVSFEGEIPSSARSRTLPLKVGNGDS